MEPEARLGLSLQTTPMIQRDFEQMKSARNVGFDKHRRPVDRAIDMTFRRQMHHGIDALFG